MDCAQGEGEASEAYRREGLGVNEAAAKDVYQKAGVIEKIGAEERALDLGDDEDSEVGLLAEGDGEVPHADSLDRRPIGSDEGARRDALSLMRRGREDPHLRAGVDEEPAFGGGVDDVEELVDAGTRRHYWQPALAFPDCAAEHGGMQDLAFVP